jgi:hypothetical protein
VTFCVNSAMSLKDGLSTHRHLPGHGAEGTPGAPRGCPAHTAPSRSQRGRCRPWPAPPARCSRSR